MIIACRDLKDGLFCYIDTSRIDYFWEDESTRCLIAEHMDGKHSYEVEGIDVDWLSTEEIIECLNGKHDFPYGIEDKGA